MNIDWSKAPEGATHWGPAVGGYCEAWVKSDMVGWLCLPTSGGAGWIRERRLISDLVERPISEYQRPWNGEGLPPVGEIIEWLDGEFLKAVVVGHHQGAVVAVDDDDPRRVFIGKKPCYRPLRTPEQIAAEEREKAVDEMVKVWKRTMGRFAQEERGLAEMLYDHGYRKQEQTK